VESAGNGVLCRTATPCDSQFNHCENAADMKMTPLVGVALAVVTIAQVAHAQTYLDGSLAAVVDPFVSSSASYSDSSLTLNAQNIITLNLTGTLAALVPGQSDLTAYAGTVSGLSVFPASENIADYFVFSSPDSFFSTSGTTPNNRFSLTLTSLTDLGGGVFTGAGTLVDASDVYSPTPANFTLSFSGGSTYSFSMAAQVVPEPGTSMVLGLGLLGLLAVPRFSRQVKLQGC
jgi:hypothetical protein